MSFSITKRTFLQSGCALAAGLAVGVRPRKARAGAPDSQTAQRGFMRPRPSRWFTRLDDDFVRCTLCPEECRLAPGRRGPCRVRENRRGRGYTLSYANPAILQTDPIERKPFFHILPGSRSLSVATAGCNMSCKFCQVWDMALVDPEDVYAYEATPQDVVRHARNADARSVAFTFGEPVACFEYMLDTARLAHEADLLTLFHSNGYIQPKPLNELCAVLDGANIDLKGFDPDFYRDICGGERDPVLDTLKTLRNKEIHTEITSLLIPTLNDREDDIRRMSRWIRDELGADTPVHFSRFYPLYKLAHLPPTPVSTLETARAAALEEGLEYVYIANVPGHESESTRCPKCENMLIDRLGFVVEAVHIENGRCRHCGQSVPGRWG